MPSVYPQLPLFDLDAAEPVRFCKLCENWKVLSAFTGRNHRCKECLKPYFAAYRRGEHIPTRTHPKLAPDATSKSCQVCGIEQPLGSFPRQLWTCRACCKAANDQYRLNNAERIRRYKQHYNKAHPEPREIGRIREERYRTAHKERVAKIVAEWHKAHPDKIRDNIRRWNQRHPDLVRARLQRHRADNPLMYRAYSHKRRLRKMEGGTWMPDEWNMLVEQYNHTCLMCGMREPEIVLTFDHVIPLSKGGSNTIDNAQPLCGLCNSKKSTHSWDFRPAY